MIPRLPHLLGEAAFALAGAALRRLDWPAAQDLGAALGRSAARAVRSRWKLTLDNLRLAFPDETESRRRQWALASWENLGRIGAECLWAEGRPAEEILRWVRFDGAQSFLEASKKGKGALVHLGHFANWEAAGLAWSALGHPLSVVARRMRNPGLDRRVNALRSRFGTEVIVHKKPFFPCMRALRRERHLAILMDQNTPAGDLFVPFFGRPASTTPLTALLAHRTGRPVFFLALEREGRTLAGRFVGPLPLGPTPEATAAALTQVLEDWARRHPGEWFWFHNRWKKTPPEAVANPAERVRP